MCCNYNIKIFIITQMQAFFIVIDDIQDRSLLRRGQPCWYRYNDIGLGAINDGFLLQCCMFYLLEKYFNGKDYYVQLLETFHDVSKDIFLFTRSRIRYLNANLFFLFFFNQIIIYKSISTDHIEDSNRPKFRFALYQFWQETKSGSVYNESI